MRKNQRRSDGSHILVDAEVLAPDGPSQAKRIPCYSVKHAARSIIELSFTFNTFHTLRGAFFRGANMHPIPREVLLAPYFNSVHTVS